ncbi:Conserved hypothetical protein [Candidatus Protochlamydia naegleriophila]|uniref:Uncharacterized protein n=1 Tax=Candidatus Protochlamydia naegleriophila TaxID=389348 RepID=A0A0U5JGA3_9BACT|nr:hypothetical protein [Candidatus Protochlamydia naegleriophila]CUI16790.1 Conserved hypothetical protein [Candidatus Protochlamydia naegleriophila]
MVQLADQALKDAEQQYQEWDEHLQNLQTLKQEAESVQIDLNESNQKLEEIEDHQSSNFRELSNLQITHTVQEKRMKKISEDLSNIESDQNNARDQIRTINALQASVLQSQDELLNRLNRAPGPSILDSLKVEMWEKCLEGKLKAQQVISKINDQIKLLPTYIKNASSFLWDTFSLLSSATIQAISILGQKAFKLAYKGWNFAERKVEEWGAPTPILLALGFTSLCILRVTGDPLSFAATAVCGFLLIRRASRTLRIS